MRRRRSLPTRDSSRRVPAAVVCVSTLAPYAEPWSRNHCIRRRNPGNASRTDGSSVATAKSGMRPTMDWIRMGIPWPSERRRTS